MIAGISSNCQSELDALRNQRDQLKREIASKSDSLDLLMARINGLENQQLIEQISKDHITINTTVALNGVIRDSCFVFANTIASVIKGDSLEVMKYDQGCWFVKFQENYGFISWVFLNESDDMIKYKILRDSMSIEEEKLQKEIAIEEEKKRIQKKREAQDAEWRASEKVRKANLINLYGKETGEKLFEGYYWIGMTDDMARASLGKPQKINSTVNTNGRNEQWVYHNLYLYFDNGKLTTYQKSE